MSAAGRSRQRAAPAGLGLLSAAAGVAVAVLVGLAAVTLPHPGAAAERAPDRLAAVTDRGTLRCGVGEDMAGFVRWSGDAAVGFAPDFCRVVAAAVLGDAERVDYVRVDAAEAFADLRAGDVDLLAPTVERTAAGEGREQVAFAAVTFHDGLGVMVRDEEYTALDEMQQTLLCAVEAPGLERRLAGRLDALSSQLLTFADAQDVERALAARACDGWAGAVSQLAAHRAGFPDSAGGPEALSVLPDLVTLRPYAPAVAADDHRWRDAVNWAVLATMTAEEHGVDSSNVDGLAGADDPLVRRMLGDRVLQEDGFYRHFDPGLGLPRGFGARVVAEVGNYGEIFERRLGAGTAYGLPRGPNALWTGGGLHYPPPLR